MKTSIKNLFLVPALIAGLALILAGRLTAQTFTNLHNLDFVSDGSFSQAGLILSGNTLYGTANDGGSSFKGTVFAVHTDGTGFTNLHSFAGASDGANPKGGLILSGETLYGTANGGGSSNFGTVFSIHTDGTGFVNLHSFTNVGEGVNPQAGLVLSGNILYGTANSGGSSNRGAIFALNTDGTGFTNLHSLNGVSDGANPRAGLVLSGSTLLYGTASSGGSSNRGTVFAINTDGSGFSNLHDFAGVSDGLSPEAGLILSGNTLYGTANGGGSAGRGTVYAVNTDGSGFTNLYSFTAHSGSPAFTNSDGVSPIGGLILSGNTLYGTAFAGGSSASGTSFSLHTDGTSFANMHSFAGVGDGANPRCGLILSGNTLFGTASTGGSSGNGTVFSLSLGSVSAPQLTIIRSGADVLLTWPTNFTGFTLEANTNLNTSVWAVVTNAPSTSGTNNVVTYSVAELENFFRLRSP